VCVVVEHRKTFETEGYVNSRDVIRESVRSIIIIIIWRRNLVLLEELLDHKNSLYL
jgi:hypothetical protein